MTTTDFARELKGFADIRDTPPTAIEWAIINAKLESCFVKQTPASPFSITGMALPIFNSKEVRYC